MVLYEHDRELLVGANAHGQQLRGLCAVNAQLAGKNTG
jgi:hypothetical protein